MSAHKTLLLRRGFTLLEVVVASAVLALLVLMLSMVTIPMQQQAVGAQLHFDQEARARKLVDELRREIRQSGWEGSTEYFDVNPDGNTGDTNTPTSPDGTAISDAANDTSRIALHDVDTSATPRVFLLKYQKRKGLSDGAWGEHRGLLAVYKGTYTGVAGAVRKWSLQWWIDTNDDGAVTGNELFDFAANVSDVAIAKVSGARTLLIAIELCDPDPRWTSGSPPDPVQRVYVDQIEMLNTSESGS